MTSNRLHNHKFGSQSKIENQKDDDESKKEKELFLNLARRIKFALTKMKHQVTKLYYIKCNCLWALMCNDDEVELSMKFIKHKYRNTQLLCRFRFHVNFLYIMYGIILQ